MREFPIDYGSVSRNRRPDKVYTLRWEGLRLRMRVWRTGRDNYGAHTATIHATIRWRDGSEEYRADFTADGRSVHEPHTLPAIYGWITGLCLAPDDTESERFAEYTERQMRWAHSAMAEELGGWALEREEMAAKAYYDDLERKSREMRRAADRRARERGYA